MRHMAFVVVTSDLRVGHPVTRGCNSRSYKKKRKYPDLCTVEYSEKTPINPGDRGPDIYNADH